jgi:hypothetical protein
MIGELVLTPLLPWPVIAAFAIVVTSLSLLGLARGAGGALWRLAAGLLLVAALLDPRLVREDREPQSDVVVALIDRSASQTVGQRTQRTDQALAHLRAQLKRFPETELRIATVRDAVPKVAAGTDAEGTLMMRSLRQALGGVPRQRLAGMVIIGDGQVHDISTDTVSALPEGVPVHVLLSGDHAEKDRRIVVEKAPAYGLVGKRAEIRYRVEDRLGVQAGAGLGDLARVTLREGERVLATAQVAVGKDDSFKVPLTHAGPTVLTLEVAPVKGELSTVNNKTLVTINGVRDRLRVLLVSGQPHAGERTWRNLLKADPAVDLVHFTILRPPEKDDFTPLNEISLIAFPTRELFEVKLKEFDLVVLDRYVVRDVLPPSYLRNIDAYIKGGGALLLAVGPEFATDRSLYNTPLGQALPVTPSGKVLAGGFQPSVNQIGRRHPVTANLPGQGRIAEGGETTAPKWGRWFRQIEATVKAGHTLMEGPSARPLLVLDRYGEGRVAAMLSDHIWLWARGYEGGGPYAELLRRTAHWLMKEPELEEDGLRAEIQAGKLIVHRRSLNNDPAELTINHPGGQQTRHALSVDQYGLGRLEIPANAVGLYRISDGRHEALAAAGAINPIEFADLRSTDRVLRPVVKHSGGGLHWIADGLPDIRMVRPGRDRAGKGWLGMIENRAYVVTGVAETPLLPPVLLIVLLLGLIMAAWWREGR